MSGQAPLDRPVPELVAQCERQARRVVAEGPSGRVVWHAWGDGPPLVLLHGGAGSWRHWVRNLEVLAQHHQVLAPDLPGMGESDVPRPAATPDDIAHLVEATMTQVLDHEPRFHLVGFSFGGLIAGHLASRLAPRVRSLTLVGTGGWPDLPTRTIDLVPVRALTDAARWTAHRENLARLMLADPRSIDDTATWIQAWNTDRARLNTRRFYRLGPLAELLPTLDLPVNGIWGELDALAAANVDARQALLARLCRDLAFRRIKGGGHWVAYERAEAFNAALLELLARAA